MASQVNPASDANKNYENFQLVQRKRGKGKQKRTAKMPQKGVQDRVDVIVDSDRHRVTKRIRDCRTELEASDFYRKLLDTIERALTSVHTLSNAESDRVIMGNQHTNSDTEQTEIHVAVPTEQFTYKDLDILVYGLGNFVSCVTARYQLSLVLALRDHLQVSPEHCQVYDPQFTETEKLILQEFDCTLIRRNEEGKRRCERPTLVVMPHCGKALFNNFLWANWRPQSLQQLIIIGNSFSNMLDSVPERLWRNHLHYVNTILPFVKEEAVQNTFTYTDIFNDLSVHWFPLENLQRVAPGTWTQPDEPVYLEDDLEIIQDSLNKL